MSLEENKPAEEVKAAASAAWLKIAESALEVIGLAVLLTAVQITLFHILFSDSLVDWYITFYQNYVREYNLLYYAFIFLLTNIFGNSYTVTLYNFIEKVFIPVFIVNLGYFALSKYKRRRNEAD